MKRNFYNKYFNINFNYFVIKFGFFKIIFYFCENYEIICIMEINEQPFNDLLSDNDYSVDEEVVEDEVIEQDPLGLNDFISKDNDVPEEPQQEEPQQEEQPSDFISQYLKEHGISDTSKIQMENESGEIEEVDFNTLDDESKLNILNSISEPGYSDYEKNVIDYLRRNNVTLDDVIAYYQQQAVTDYLSQHPEAVHTRVYNIDEYTDDEVYLADLKSKYPNFTDDELLAKLDSAKLNEDLFSKEVTAIRENQKAIEEEQIKQQEETEEQNYQILQQNLQNVMQNFVQIDLDPEDKAEDALSLDVTDADRELMMRYLMERDKDGKSQLIRDLEDPNALVELAYYRTRERDNLTGLTRYWKNELANERKEKAKLQKELDKLKNKEKNSFVVSPETSKPSSKPRKIMDIYG